MDKPERISELIEGQKLFDSTGYSLVKVTKDGKERWLELPIKSTGVAEYMDKLSGSAPRPPVIKRVVKKDSPEGKELGLTHDKLMQVFDTTDEAYVDALNRHNQDFNWRVAIFALDLAWKKSDGTEAKTFVEKKTILQSTGITWGHIEQVFKDVKNLTTVQEAKIDFLPES